MELQENEHPSLPKWPASFVTGKTVTPEQAKDIIFRTDSSLAYPSEYGFGFSAEGDWKTSALLRTMKVMSYGQAGGTSFTESVNSGLPQIGIAGGGAGRGLITAGTLEMSNVDLSQEFTNLIIAQRGFQANSRVITTSDELLQEVVNLKR